MGSRILLWGATGYTGRLVAATLCDVEAPVTLAGRNEARLRQLSAELPGAADWDVAVADAGRPDSVRRLVTRETVVIATAGPFSRVGWPAAHAAAEAGAAYLDCTGEPPFLRRVHEILDPAARKSGAVLAPAFGYDFVPGQLAAAFALADAPEATGVRVGYFTEGRRAKQWLSGGTRASVASILTEPSYVWHHGQLVTERAAARLAYLRGAGRSLPALSIGSAEHLFLPRRFPRLRDVDVYLGWAGEASRAVQLGAALMAPAMRLPGSRRLLDRATLRLAPGSTGGPSSSDRALVRTLAVADALDGDGRVLAHSEVRGPNPYELTATLLARAARALTQERGAAMVGVVGPLELFGVEPMATLAEEAGLSRVG